MASKKELKDQRIPIMMSESELLALDDWSFKKRIRSRGEAIRRLCQMGLVLDEHITDLFEETKKSAYLYRDRTADITELFSDTQRPAKEIVLALTEIIPELLRHLQDLTFISNEVALKALPYTLAPEFKDAQELSDLLKLAVTELDKRDK